MIATAVVVGLFAVGTAMLLDLYRLARGPDLPDRILALDTLFYNAIAVLMLVGLYFGDTSYFGSALVVATLGFISTVALCKYVLRGSLVD